MITKKQQALDKSESRLEIFSVLLDWHYAIQDLEYLRSDARNSVKELTKSINESKRKHTKLVQKYESHGYKYSGPPK